MKQHSLSSDERIKSRKDFELLFNKGTLIFSRNSRLKALYLIEKNSQSPGVKIAAAISKKAGSAPWRNRIKRLMKEVYRLNKYLLSDKTKGTKSNLKVIFSCNFLNARQNRKVTLSNIYPDMLDLMNKISIDL